MNKALFLILDGTLITTKSGRSFPLHEEDWKFTTRWELLLKDSIKEGYKIILVDNQLAVGEGTVNEASFYKKDNKICQIIEKDLDLPKNSIATTYCFNEENRFYVKPNPGLLYEIALEYDVILSNSILIGNSEVDELFAKNAGVSSYYTLDDIKLRNLNEKD